MAALSLAWRRAGRGPRGGERAAILGGVGGTAQQPPGVTLRAVCADEGDRVTPSTWGLMCQVSF